MSIFAAFSTALLTRLGLRAFPPLFVLALTVALGVPTVQAGELDEASQLFKSGQHAKALDQVNHFLVSKPKDPQARFLKGIILTGQNKLGDAIAVFKKLTEDYPELPEPFNNLAVIYAQQKQYDKAKEALEMAIRTHPAYATAHENLGDIYSRLASQAYGKALQIDSSNASAQTKLSMINDLVGGGKAPPTVTAAPTPTVIAAAKPMEPVKPVAVAEAKPVPAAPAAKPELKPEAKAEPKPEAKPEPKPEQKPEPKAESKAKPANAEAEITAAVDGWLAAWSKKDVKTYLAHYARDFDTPGSMSRKEWEVDRTKKVGKPGKIDVNRGKLSIKAAGEDKAAASFRQTYASASFKASSNKTLHLVKRDGKWQIQQELVD